MGAKTSGFSRRPEALAGERRTIQDNDQTVFFPPTPPCEGSNSGIVHPARIRALSPDSPTRLAHPTTPSTTFDLLTPALVVAVVFMPPPTATHRGMHPRRTVYEGRMAICTLGAGSYDAAMVLEGGGYISLFSQIEKMPFLTAF